ncbi:P-loop containing nucleoside triphosphate hydrolase protein [Aspergillus sclerotiicarbonarius CBS 121057]|uniref:P-loop containing nucleoside triphosphate hydrolase protein n=1 Tax=Aspergillus sclerotiicarbonarius (strain CBS 121057 / IBT 28362) TaxID=1448318 RepID=A0A319EK60_ASPSB|nr:P-loop containing nucleoside triphosphate hydrolase protein [Aspergillus sclerotiicarbonarius CBS 121057]
MGDSTGSVEVQSLERRYIGLLEQRIAQLEKLVASNATPEVKESETPTPTPESDKKEDKPSEVPAPNTATETKDTNGKEGEEVVKKEEETTEGNPRIRLLDSRYNEEKGIFEDVPSNLPPTNKGSEPSLPYAFTWRRSFDEAKKYTGSNAIISSSGLENLIKSTCRPSSVTSYNSFSDKFDILVWDWEKLEEAASAGDAESPNVDAADLQLLLERVRSTSELESYFQKRDQWAKNAEIPFEYLWTLFPPGEMVYSHVVFDCPQVFIAREYTYEDYRARNGTDKSYFSLTCWSYDWNGETFNRVSATLNIDKYTGAKAINTLKLYPLKNYVDRNGNPSVDELRDSLRKRGEKFRDFCVARKGSQLFYCDGPIISKETGYDLVPNNSNQFDTNSSAGLETLTGPVIVDHRSFIQYAAADDIAPMGDLEITDNVYECTCSECRKSRELKNMMKFNYDDVAAADDFDEDQFIICPARFLGYSMKSKKWVQMPVDCVHEIKQKIRMDAFDKLIMEETSKKLIKSLVANHEKKKKAEDGGKGGNDDWFEGKGGGLVILLHGPPGVGKTSTAESVAQATGKPLFAVSVSDIGLKPDQVESKLAQVFSLASKWEAILLFDEADVFLESRGTDKGDLNRNSLVTVFLRILEYYDGILILTTNRIKTFDVAVQSRVHLAMRYNNMQLDELRQLFLQFINERPKEIADLREMRNWIEEEFDEEVDGRQIRNIVSSARALAKSDDNYGGKLKLAHIKRVLKMTVQFQKHLRDQRVAAQRDRVNDR